MKKSFKLVDLDCANCAAKTETALNKIKGVNKATVSFMTQRVTIDADDELFDEIMQEVMKTTAKTAHGCKIIM